MKTPRFILAGSLLAFSLSALVLSPLAAAPAKEDVLIDFTDVRIEPGTNQVIKNYEYDYGDWSKRIRNTARQGCLIQAPGGKGGIGENKTLVDFKKTTAVTLVFVIGNENRAKSINFGLTDRDGTEQSWSIPFEGLPKGREIRFPLDLTKCTNESKPGDKPGLNLKKIASWQISGDYSEPSVEVLLIKVVAPKS